MSRAALALRGAIATLAAALSACAGIRPPVPAAAAVTPPAAWRGEVEAAGNPAPDWWAAFDDPALAKVVDAALAGNLDIAVAASRIEETRAAFAAAESRRLPEVDGRLERLRERDVNPAYGTPELQTGTAAGLSLTFDTDLFGKLRDASAAARASLLSTRAAHAEVRLATASLAAREYLALRSQDQRLAILQQTLQARERSLAIVRRRVEAGYSSQLDLAQAQADQRAAEALIAPTRLAIARTEDALGVLLGTGPQPIARGAGEPLPAAPPVPVALPAALLRRRPDLVAAEENLVAADSSLDASRAAFMPDLQLSASLGQVSSSLIGAHPVDVFSFGGSLLAPILDAGRLKAQEDAVAARRDQAAFAYRRAALRAFAEVEDALAAARRTHEQLAALLAGRDALRRSLELATRRYRAGYAPFLDQLDAQRGLLAAELSIADAQAAQAIAAVNLWEAAGGGWDADAPAKQERPFLQSGAFRASPPIPLSVSSEASVHAAPASE